MKPDTQKKKTEVHNREKNQTITVKEYALLLAKYFLLSILFTIFIEILARHSVVEGLLFVWNHPFLTNYSALILTQCYMLSFLFPKRKFVWVFVTAIVAVLAITNFVLLFFRITPLSATDFGVFTSVFEIMGVYLKIWQIVLIAVFLLTVTVLLVILAVRMPRQDFHLLLGSSFFAMGLLIIYLMTQTGVRAGFLQTDFANLPDAYRDNGFVYCFACSLFDKGIAKPEEYDEEIVEDVKEALKLQKTAEPLERPNIIFLQLESFIDLSRVKGAKYSKNPQPVYQGIRKSCQTGYLKVPSVGAGTANTEFEILCGMDTQFFGAGEYPYKTILQDVTCESLANNLRELGYQSTVLHNNTATFYDRDVVFSNIGFDRFSSIEYMKEIEYNEIHWAKDHILISQIMDSLTTTKEQDFIYTITVQDHGKYPKEELAHPEIDVTNFSEENEERLQAFTYYVNEVHETDNFLGSLLAQLSSFEEPVLLVLYGDHLPNLEMTSEEIEGGDLFQTEYVIWTNKAFKKKIDFQVQMEDLAAYQLSAYVLGRLGMNNGMLTKFHQTFQKRADYSSQLEMLQYDMLYGEHEIYEGVIPYKPSNLQMGLYDIKLQEMMNIGDSFYVTGENFTTSSKIYVDGQKQDTIFVSENMLMVEDYQVAEEETVFVGQVNIVGELLTQTREEIYE